MPIIDHINFMNKFSVCWLMCTSGYTKYWGTRCCLTQPYIFPDFVPEREFLPTSTASQIEERYNKAGAYVDKLTRSILAKTFCGELVPRDSNDEPVPELLQRIKNRLVKKTRRRRQQAG